MITIQKKPALGYTVYVPTRKDIRQGRREIQATWSPRTRAKRTRGPRAAWWIPPTIQLAGLVDALNEERSDGPS